MTRIIVDCTHTFQTGARTGIQRMVRKFADSLLEIARDDGPPVIPARIEAGRLELEMNPFELTPLLDGIAALLAPVAEKRGLRFVRGRMPPMPVVVTGDATRLRHVRTT